MKKLQFYSLLFISIVFLSAIFCDPLEAQKVKQDANGNYIAVKAIKEANVATNSGRTYTDSKGIVFPVMLSKAGRLFIIRTSKAGNEYKMYLKTEMP